MNKMGDVMFTVEDVVTQMAEEHDMQKGEMLSLFAQYIDNHFPGAIEEYEDGTHPIYFYGPKETFYKLYGKGK